MNEARFFSRSGLALPLLVALVACLSFVALGTWQLQRKAWKEGLIATLERRLAAAPVDLPPREQWSRLTRDEDEFRRIKFAAAFEGGAEALVYTSGSTLRDDVSGPGYWIFAPARIGAGGVIVVNRGFVAEGRRDPATRISGEVSTVTEMVGAMRWGEERSFFAPADSPRSNLYFVRDPSALAAAKGWGEVPPFYIELEAPVPAGGLPHPSPLKVNLRNEHLQYAITWYGLALVTVVMFTFWLGKRRADVGEVT